MSSGGVSFFLFLSISLLLLLAILLLSRWCGRRRKGQRAINGGGTALPDIGEEPRRLPFRPYLVLAIAAVFQAVLVVLFAWVEVFPSSLEGDSVPMEPLFFVGVVLVGLVYVWRKGGFSWD